MRNELDAKLLKFVDCVRKWGTLLLSRSNRQTTTTSKRPRRASANGCVKPGPYVSSSTDTICVYTYNAPTAALSMRAEQLFLHLRSLIENELLAVPAARHCGNLSVQGSFHTLLRVHPSSRRTPAVYLKSAEVSIFGRICIFLADDKAGAIHTA
jgi:hypothetical protein